MVCPLANLFSIFILNSCCLYNFTKFLNFYKKRRLINFANLSNKNWALSYYRCAFGVYIFPLDSSPILCLRDTVLYCASKKGIWMFSESNLVNPLSSSSSIIGVLSTDLSVSWSWSEIFLPTWAWSSTSSLEVVFSFSPVWSRLIPEMSRPLDWIFSLLTSSPLASSSIYSNFNVGLGGGWRRNYGFYVWIGCYLGYSIISGFSTGSVAAWGWTSWCPGSIQRAEWSSLLSFSSTTALANRKFIFFFSESCNVDWGGAWPASAAAR